MRWWLGDRCRWRYLVMVLAISSGCVSSARYRRLADEKADLERKLLDCSAAREECHRLSDELALEKPRLAQKIAELDGELSRVMSECQTNVETWRQQMTQQSTGHDRSEETDQNDEK